MTTSDESTRWHRYAPGAGSDQDLRDLRTLLAGYTQPEIDRIRNVPAVADGEIQPAPTPFEVLVRLFSDCHYVSEDDVPPDTLALLGRLGLIARDAEDSWLIYATAAILPVAGEWVVCDRGGAPDGSPYTLPADVVYPPIFDNSRRYLAVLPSTPCDAMLELGTGAGLATMLAARHAGHVWATDITQRSVDFAKLSCRLAELDNVTLLQGDLYSPVEGLTFDRIAIHPPWVPASHSNLVFGDGGEDGEQIIRGTIEGLPRFLRPAGRFYTIFMASDRVGERFEQRVRRWLGDDEGQFDVLIAEFSCETTQVFLSQNLAKGSIGQAEVATWTALFDATRSEALVYGQMIVQRHASSRDPITVRTPANQAVNARQLEALLDQ